MFTKLISRTTPVRFLNPVTGLGKNFYQPLKRIEINRQIVNPLPPVSHLRLCPKNFKNLSFLSGKFPRNFSTEISRELNSQILLAKEEKQNLLLNKIRHTLSQYHIDANEILSCIRQVDSVEVLDVPNQYSHEYKSIVFKNKGETILVLNLTDHWNKFEIVFANRKFTEEKIFQVSKKNYIPLMKISIHILSGLVLFGAGLWNGNGFLSATGNFLVGVIPYFGPIFAFGLGFAIISEYLEK